MGVSKTIDKRFNTAIISGKTLQKSNDKDFYNKRKKILSFRHILIYSIDEK
jgi:hypothetical protein